jgi:hypothetical protein
MSSTIKAPLSDFFSYTRENIFNIETHLRSIIKEEHFNGLAIANINKKEELAEFEVLQQ